MAHPTESRSCWSRDFTLWVAGVERVKDWASRRREARVIPAKARARGFGVSDPLVAHNWTIGATPVLCGDGFDAAREYLRQIHDWHELDIADRAIALLWNRLLVKHGVPRRGCV